MRVMNEVKISNHNIFVYSDGIFLGKSTYSHTGIDVVRNRIKGFAQKKVTLPQGRHKLVILDEADR